ncbi:MAG: T9SS type A sorting domain-containing protein [Bacteroidia bacterium]|nr:T9SS type A sorting domain-containing protein [Bacteroidia bacterium]
MKKQVSFLLLTLLTIVATAFSPNGLFRASGPAANGAGDVTMSPLSGGVNCNSCHSGGSFPVTVQAVVADLSGNPVTSYVPGQTYNVGVQVTGGTRKGFQLVALRGANLQAGSFSAPLGGSQLVPLSGRTYFEHNTPGTTGLWAATWTAPPAGQGAVTFYFSGLAADFNGANNGDNAVSGSLVLPAACNNVSTTQQASICQGQSYTVGGNTYTTSGTYTDLFPLGNGCDSAVTTQLTVHPVYNQTLNISICQGQSYSFNGVTYTANTTQSAHFNTIHNCDSNVTLNLSVVPLIQVNQSVSICQGETLQVGSSVYNTAGNYTDTLSAAGGCDSVVHTTLSINPVNSSSLSAAICQGQTYILGGNTYTTAGVHTAILQNSAGCDSTVSLTLQVNPLPVASLGNDTILCPSAAPYTLQTQAGYASYNWTGVSSSTHSAQVSSSGTYSVTVSDSNGCSSSDAVNIQFSSSACLGMENSSMEALRIYPNPVRDHLYIDAEENVSLEIYSSSGQQVFRGNVYKKADLSQLPPGLYMAKAGTAQGVFYTKIIRE